MKTSSLLHHPCFQAIVSCALKQIWEVSIVNVTGQSMAMRNVHILFTGVFGCPTTVANVETVAVAPVSYTMSEKFNKINKINV
jgi:hypothetical protein